MRRLRRAAGVAVCCSLAAACGGSPSTPTPTPSGNGGGGPSTQNTAPVIQSIVVSDPRVEAGAPVTVTATVTDAETPVANLSFAWSADNGTFSGTGPTVSWTPAADAATPGDFSVRLTVTETVSGAQPNVVSRSATVHVNNSPKELADLSLRFLGDFADSKVSPDTCVAEFSATQCANGKSDEFSDISDNRHDFEILSSTLRANGVSVASDKMTATVHTFCAFTSKVITTSPRDESCANGKCPLGSVGSVQGDCWTTDVYENGRWWLCQSHFTSSGAVTAFARAFFRLGAHEIR